MSKETKLDVQFVGQEVDKIYRCQLRCNIGVKEGGALPSNFAGACRSDPVSDILQRLMLFPTHSLSSSSNDVAAMLYAACKQIHLIPLLFSGQACTKYA